LIDEGPGVLGAIGMGTRGVGGRRVFAEKNANEQSDVSDSKIDSKIVTDASSATDPFDDTVLRFFCSYDGRANGGALLKYTLNYFLRDNTVEVLEEQGRNTGLDPFPKMLTRSRLPANGGFDVGPPGEGRLGRGRSADSARARHRRRRLGGRVRPVPVRARLRREHARVLRQDARQDARGDGGETVTG
jgi:hypothetical protein